MPHQRKYIVDARWWRNWCDFTGFQSHDSPVELPEMTAMESYEDYKNNYTPREIEDNQDENLEMMRREMQLQRDMKSQITLFNAHKQSPREITSENGDLIRDSSPYRNPGKMIN